MINYQEVIEIHRILIQKFGGLQGIRDQNALKSAIIRPFGGYDNVEFYPTTEEKAAAILESIVKNHPFIDGNKRSGYVLMRLTLMNHGKDVNATQEEKYAFIIAIASGKLDFQQIADWIKQKTVAR
jgi:death-on-curing protein